MKQLPAWYPPVDKSPAERIESVWGRYLVLRDIGDKLLEDLYSDDEYSDRGLRSLRDRSDRLNTRTIEWANAAARLGVMSEADALELIDDADFDLDLATPSRSARAMTRVMKVQVPARRRIDAPPQQAQSTTSVRYSMNSYGEVLTPNGANDPSNWKGEYPIALRGNS